MSAPDPVERVFGGGCSVSVFGLGYVGLALTAAYLRKGLKVVGVDKDPSRISALTSLSLKFLEREVGEAINSGLSSGLLRLTTNGLEYSTETCVNVVTVPVYVDWLTKEVNYDAILQVADTVGKGLKTGDMVILESSVPPGTTEGMFKSRLEEASGLTAGRDFYLAYSPERIYVGHALRDIEANYPKIVAGVDASSTECVARFYSKIALKGVIRMSSIRAAEFSKLVEGVYRDVNIALANELAILSELLSVDYYEVRNAANSQPYCHLHLPGPGVGGPCIPIYPYLLVGRALSKGFVPRLIKLAREINESMPYEVVRRVELFLRDYGLALDRVSVAVLGVAFRGDTDDARLSPAREVIALLKARGCKNIIAQDPLVSKDEVLESLQVPLTRDLRVALEGRELVVVLTRHSEYDKLTTEDIVRLSGNPNILIFDSVNIIHDNNRYRRIRKLGGSG
ncbi:MAG: nucleotide sugar dehydrogenase [Zestosphaera sp.]